MWVSQAQYPLRCRDRDVTVVCRLFVPVAQIGKMRALCARGVAYVTDVCSFCARDPLDVSLPARLLDLSPGGL